MLLQLLQFFHFYFAGQIHTVPTCLLGLALVAPLMVPYRLWLLLITVFTCSWCLLLNWIDDIALSLTAYLSLLFTFVYLIFPSVCKDRLWRLYYFLITTSDMFLFNSFISLTRLFLGICSRYTRRTYSSPECT